MTIRRGASIFFELRDECVAPPGGNVLDPLATLGVPFEEAFFFAGCTGSRGLLAPTTADLEVFQKRARTQSLAEWGRGAEWGRRKGVPRTCALEAPSGDRGAVMHLKALLAMLTALESRTPTAE